MYYWAICHLILSYSSLLFCEVICLSTPFVLETEYLSSNLSNWNILPLIIYYYFKALGYYCSQIGFLLEYLQQHLNVKVISLPINGSRSLFMGNLLLLQNNQWIWIIDFKIKHFFKSLGSVLYCWNVFVIKYWLLIIVGSYSNMVRFIYSLKMCVF